jgi:hypothetical protein
VVVGEQGSQAADEAAQCLARQYHCDGQALLTADASAENLCWLRARHPGLPVRKISPDALRAAILAAHGDTLKQEAVEGLARRLPDLSARRVLTGTQKLFFATVAVALVVMAWAWPQVLLQGVTALLALAFVLAGLFRVALAWIGAGGPAANAPLPRYGLPLYTILVPLYQEAAVLPRLAAALRALDYPDMTAQVPQEI